MTRQSSGAALLLETLSRHGVDKIFLVSGTDYPAFTEENLRGVGPDLFLVPHEITAVSAAIGYSLGGKLGVAAVHTLPGTANSIGSIMNAYGSRVPLLLIAGRTPYTEAGSAASRNGRIHWTQETRDQGEMIRQWTKWDFEVRRCEQVPIAISRAIQIAKSEPCGPVYFVLPREVSIEKSKNQTLRAAPFEPGPSPEAVTQSRKLINESKNPLIITWRAGRRESWFNALSNFADHANIPVLNYAGEQLNYPASGKMAVDSFDLPRSDLVIVAECDVPWIPKSAQLGPDAKVIKVDCDPAHQYIPYYGFPSDVSAVSCIDHFFNALIRDVVPKDDSQVLKLRNEQIECKRREINHLKKSKRIHPRYLSYQIGKLGMPVVNEYRFDPKYANFNSFGSYFSSLATGYIGWALGASVGLKMSTRKDFVAAVGDGSFIFGVPDAFYYIAHDYPVMVAIFDNGGWLSSSKAALDVFPEGVAAAKKRFPGTEFKRYEIGATVKAYGGYFELIEKPDQVASALQRGKTELKKRKKISVLQFIVERIL
ncbi:MAG: thiamine pyrophosphate-requiring protein [Nitrososphaerales archaeon]